MNRLLITTLLLNILTLPTLAQTSSQEASATATVSGNNNTVNQTINQNIFYHPGLVNRRQKPEKLENRGRSRSFSQGEDKEKKPNYSRSDGFPRDDD